MNQKLDWPLLKEFLDEKADLYNRTQFIELDPISIPRRYSKPEDIEIAGFFAATIAWGVRKSIIANGTKLMALMDDSPHSFVMNHTAKDLACFEKFVHRTFNGNDAVFFVQSLQNIYRNHGGLKSLFETNASAEILNLKATLCQFRKTFFEVPHQTRSRKHVSNPDDNSASKRLNMYLRWMVRKDNRGVDFGLWDISPSLLSCPLDVHSGRVARQLGLLTRTQNDWKAVEELDTVLRKLNPADPVKYDFALFGLGAEPDWNF